MTTIEETLRTFKIGNFTVEVVCIDYCEPGPWLGELFKVSDRHIGGVTIRNPVNPGDSRYHQWYIPTQCSLAELSRDYARQGRENPSKEAYESLQRELGWCITASDYGFVVRIRKHGIEVADVNAGFGFDYSWHYADESLEEYCKQADFRHVIRECVHEAVTEARENIARLTA